MKKFSEFLIEGAGDDRVRAEHELAVALADAAPVLMDVCKKAASFLDHAPADAERDAVLNELREAVRMATTPAPPTPRSTAPHGPVALGEARPHLYLTAASGNSFKVALVNRLLSLGCRETYVDALKGEARSEAFRAINPRGQVPYMVLPDGTGLGESNAIAWYLAEGSHLMPSSRKGRAQALQWMIFEQTSIEPYLSPARLFTTLLPGGAAERAADIPVWVEKASRGLAELDAHLKGRQFIVDEGHSVADIAVYGYTHLAGEAGIRLGDFPSVQRWVQRVSSRADHLPIDELLVPRERFGVPA